MRLIRFLKTELAADAAGWVDDGVVTRDQAQAVLARYGTELGADRRGDAGYFTLLALGALLAGLGAILLISTHWHDIPRWARLLGLVGLTAGANAAGVLRATRDEHAPAVAWLLFGSLLFGTSLFLIGRMYHLGEYFLEGIGLWALGILPIAWLARSRTLAALFSAVGFTWFCVAVEHGHDVWPAVLMAAVPLAFSLRVRRSVVLFLSGTAGLVTASSVAIVQGVDRAGGEVSLLPWLLPLVAVQGLYLLSRAMEQHRDGTLRDYGAALHLWSVRFAIVVLLPLNFAEVWQELARDYDPDLWWTGVGMVSATLLATAAATARWQELRPGREGWIEAVPGLASAAVVAAGGMAVVALAGSVNTHWAEGALPVAATATLLACGGWLIVRAIATSSTASFHLGVGTVLITALLRYFDLIGDYVGTAVLFMVGGAAMAAAATLFKRRFATPTGVES